MSSSPSSRSKDTFLKKERKLEIGKEGSTGDTHLYFSNAESDLEGVFGYNCFFSRYRCVVMTLLDVDGVVYIRASRDMREGESTHFTINVNNIDFNKYKEENFHLQTNIYLYSLYGIVNVNTHSSHKLFSKHNRFLLRGIQVGTSHKHKNELSVIL